MSATLQGDASPAAAAANGRRPGFRGPRPLLYQLISYSVIAAMNAVLSMTLINAIVFYGEIDGGWRLVGAAAATALVAMVSTFLLGSALTFRSSALFRGQLFARSLVVNLAGAALQVGIFAAVALTLLAPPTLGRTRHRRSLRPARSPPPLSPSSSLCGSGRIAPSRRRRRSDRCWPPEAGSPSRTSTRS